MTAAINANALFDFQQTKLLTMVSTQLAAILSPVLTFAFGVALAAKPTWSKIRAFRDTDLRYRDLELAITRAIEKFRLLSSYTDTWLSIDTKIKRPWKRVTNVVPNSIKV